MADNYVELFGSRDELSPENLKYFDILKTGAEALKRCHSIYSSDDFKNKNGWKKDLEIDDVRVYSTNIEHGRLFNIQVCNRWQSF